MLRGLAPVIVLVAMLVPRAAFAQACDVDGGVCPDDDHDGVAACGCPWAGTPCDCDDTDPTVFPGAPESCDAPKDNNCNGVGPDVCPKKKGCLGSVCVPECIPLDDFGCAVGSTFARQPNGQCLCAPSDCTLFGCPPGSTCDADKKCVPSCPPEVRCPHGEVCRGFGCVDPCAGITCPANAVCSEGLCIPSCLCHACPQGETCDLGAPVPACVETACVGVKCGTGQHCEHGTCVDDCDGVVCPPMRVCRRVSVNGAPAKGECVDLCAPSPCKPGFACNWKDGSCTPLPTADGGLVLPAFEGEYLEVAGAGWRCSASGAFGASALGVLGAGGAMLAFVLRRRKKNPR